MRSQVANSLSNGRELGRDHLLLIRSCCAPNPINFLGILRRIKVKVKVTSG